MRPAPRMPIFISFLFLVQNRARIDVWHQLILDPYVIRCKRRVSKVNSREGPCRPSGPASAIMLRRKVLWGLEGRKASPYQLNTARHALRRPQTRAAQRARAVYRAQPG